MSSTNLRNARSVILPSSAGWGDVPKSPARYASSTF
jgi:hypothetical protein